MSARLPARRVSGVPRTLLLVSLSGLTLFGCAQIIGLDDYTVASHAGAAGTVASAGSAGATQAGAGGAAGTAEPEGGAAGDIFVPLVVGCDGVTGFQPNEQLVRSCLLRAGCDPTFAPVRNISTCVSYNTQAALPGESCNVSSKTCADFEACEHVGVAHDDLCGAATTGTRCQGNKAINCGNYQGDDRFFDCDALGGTCGTLTFSNGELYADCKLNIAPDSCVGLPNSDSDNFCHSKSGQADARYYCWNETAFGASCTSLGTCVDAPPAGSGGGAAVTGNATCYFNTPSCTAPKVPTCSNDVATVCSSGSLFKYDCGAVGLSCAITSDTEYCLAPGCKAADVDTKCVESCSDDGSSLTFCYGGAPYTVKCTDYGFTQCKSGLDSDQVPFAACRF